MAAADHVWTLQEIASLLDQSQACPMRVVGYEPILWVTDVARAVAHYERLGFTTSSHDEGYAFAHRDDLTIHLAVRSRRGSRERALRSRR